MAAWRRLPAGSPATAPRRILIVQLDHLGDSVLTSPLIARLTRAYPAAAIDVLASPSNHEVFEADPGCESGANCRPDLVRAAPRPLGPARRGLAAGPLDPSERLRPGNRRPRRCPVGSGARLGGIPRRVGWAMGGGAFLLTDIAELGPRPPRGPLAAGPARTRSASSPGVRHGWTCMSTIADRAVVASCAGRGLAQKAARRLEVPVGPAGVAHPLDRRDPRSTRLRGRAQTPRCRSAARRAGSAASSASGRSPRCRNGGQALAPPALERPHQTVPPRWLVA